MNTEKEKELMDEMKKISLYLKGDPVKIKAFEPLMRTRLQKIIKELKDGK